MAQLSYGARDDAARDYDAVLYLSFGGPEGPDDVLPFMENVTRGRGLPRARLEEVSSHYQLFGGVSPINSLNRAVIGALRDELRSGGPDLPVYWGNRNWHPMLTDTMKQMRKDGVQRALAFVTSAYSSYSGCRQYREDIERAQTEVGDGAPSVDKLRVFYNHPGFIEPQVEKVTVALEAIPEDRRAAARLAFTAHSVPTRMADTSSYTQQLTEACGLVAERLVGDHGWDLVWQSRSGPPQVPWLEPDIVDHIAKLHAAGVEDLVIVPVGFVADHLEVRFDLDVQAAEAAARLGMNMVRAEAVGAHPRYIRMIRDLIVERMTARPERIALGDCGPSHDICGATCCPAPAGPAGTPRATA
jgi:protoporphyrin/coproporphyrin ferrochelatase